MEAILSLVLTFINDTLDFVDVVDEVVVALITLIGGSLVSHKVVRHWRFSCCRLVRHCCPYKV